MTKNIIKASNSVPGGLSTTYTTGYIPAGPTEANMTTVFGDRKNKNGEKLPIKKSYVTSQNLIDPDNSLNIMRVSSGLSDKYDENGNVINTDFWKTELGKRNNIQTYIYHQLDENGNILASDTSYTANPLLNNAHLFDTRQSVGNNHFELLKYAYETDTPVSTRARTFLTTLGLMIKRGDVSKNSSNTSLSNLLSFLKRLGGIINYLNLFK